MGVYSLLRLFLFSNVSILGYKFSSQPCFSSITKILTFCILISFTTLHFLKEVPLFSFLPVDNLEVCWLISSCLGDFPVVFLLLTFTLIPLWPKNISVWFQFFSFAEVCFMAQDMSILVNVPCILEKTIYFGFFLGGVKCCIYVKFCWLILLFCSVWLMILTDMFISFTFTIVIGMLGF